MCGCSAALNATCTSQQAGLYTIYGSLDTDLSVSAVLDVLTDYKGLARIYNNIQDSRLVFHGAQKQVHQVMLRTSALKLCDGSDMQSSLTCAKAMTLTSCERSRSWLLSFAGILMQV